MPDESDVVEEAPPPVQIGPPPVATPPASPMMPPGPMIAPRGYVSGGSFNPATGQSMSFQGVAPPYRPPDPMEQIRSQINATEFKNAQDALDAALRFQALRQIQNEAKAGVDPMLSLRKWGLLAVGSKSPNAVAPMMRETRMGAPPSISRPGGFPVVTASGRSWSPPAQPGTGASSIQTVPVYAPDGTTLPYVGAPSATGRGFTIHPTG